MFKTMSLNFLPSLEHMALAKIAIRVCNNPEIRNVIESLRDERRLCLTRFTKSNVLHEMAHASPSRQLSRLAVCNKLNGIINAKARDELSHLRIPESSREKAELFVGPIVEQINMWCEDHSTILQTFESIDFEKDLCWNSEGTIARPETAKALTETGNSGIVCRFLLACHYCFEDKIRALWDNMSDVEKMHPSLGRYPIERFWVSWLREGCTEIDWDKLAKIAGHTPRFFRRIFLKSTPAARYNSLRHFVENELISYTDLRFCLHRVEQDQRAEIFRMYPYEVLTRCLEWPIRSIYVDVARHFLVYLPEDRFWLLLYAIIYSRPTAQALEYFEILKEVWSQSPEDNKNYVKDQDIRLFVKFVLEDDFTEDEERCLGIYKEQLMELGWRRKAK